MNFPVQDTVYPDGWEAPWANWSYAWNAAYTTALQPAPRITPTAAFGTELSRYGAAARAHARRRRRGHHLAAESVFARSR